ncbi:hypothetical protein L596_013652 [Steinernema carpocapsae]|uniref:Uncharacterized protein n=1 Tax=Steinernema carpocapsae TaxID=34508 RepID=A0A4U5P1G9_STECR|nr:hypothetical protein L596_013652 [Steinernema carpocapsae]
MARYGLGLRNMAKTLSGFLIDSEFRIFWKNLFYRGMPQCYNPVFTVVAEQQKDKFVSNVTVSRGMKQAVDTRVSLKIQCNRFNVVISFYLQDFRSDGRICDFYSKYFSMPKEEYGGKFQPQSQRQLFAVDFMVQNVETKSFGTKVSTKKDDVEF